MNKSLVTEKELIEWMNCRRSGDLRCLLRDQGIPTLCGVGGVVCTTVEAINAAMGIVICSDSGAPDREVFEVL